MATWPQVEATDRRMLVLPLGSLEQHGPHLPLDTDALVAEQVARRAVGDRGDVGLAPVMALGASGEHADFPGTLSVGTEALAHVLVEVVRDATRHWGRVLVVNGHGGNADAVAQAARVCARDGRTLEIVHLGLPGMDGHAGHAETSLVLALAPDRVHLDRVAPGVTAPVPDLLDRLRSDGVRAVSPSGVLGDPTGATAAEGRVWMTRLVDLVTAHLPPRPPRR